jgi:glucosamine--fructose-6-phosphate aminotransferase (isomerizing)
MSQIEREIAEQPEVLIQVTEKFNKHLADSDELVKKLKSGYFSNIILTGMGASLCSCYCLWLKLSNYGLPIMVWETSELLNFAPHSIKNTTLLIAVSQSGESAELKKLISLDRKPGFLVGITNSNENTLAKKSDLVLELSAVGESSVSSKTYLASLTVLHLLGCKIVGQNINEETRKLIAIANNMKLLIEEQKSISEAVANLFVPAKHVTVLGRGYSLASVNYGALIIEEAARFPATGLSVPQFRHGPMETVNSSFNAIVLGGRKGIWKMNQRFIKDIITLGGKVVTISPEGEVNPVGSTYQLTIPSVEDELLPMLEIIPLQQLVISIAKSQGFEPGIFRNAGKVTHIE